MEEINAHGSEIGASSNLSKDLHPSLRVANYKYLYITTILYI
jgi:hypothetical protein